MRGHLRDVLNDRELASALAKNGRETILARHTCGHRVDELLAVCGELGLEQTADNHGKHEAGICS